MVNRAIDEGRMHRVISAPMDLYEVALHSMSEPGAHRHWYTRAQCGATSEGGPLGLAS